MMQRRLKNILHLKLPQAAYVRHVNMNSHLLCGSSRDDLWSAFLFTSVVTPVFIYRSWIVTFIIMWRGQHIFHNTIDINLRQIVRFTVHFSNRKRDKRSEKLDADCTQYYCKMVRRYKIVLFTSQQHWRKFLSVGNWMAKVLALKKHFKGRENKWVFKDDIQ